MRLSIRGKIILGFFVGLMIFMSTGVLILFSGRKISNMAVKYDEIFMIGNTIGEVSKNVDQAIKFSAPSILKNALPLFGELSAHIDEVEKVGVKAEKLKNSAEKLRKSMEENSEGEELNPEALSKLSDELIEIKESFDKLKGDYANRIKQITKFEISVLTIGIFLAAVAFTVIGFLFSTRIQYPIKKVSISLMEISQGASDLTKRIYVDSKDEIGDLSRNFNAFIEKLSEIIKRIIETINKLNEFVYKNYDMLKRFSEDISKQMLEISRISTAAEEFSSTIAESARGVNEIAYFADVAMTKFRESNRGISESLDGIIKLAEQMNKAVVQMKSLKEGQKKINNFVSSIMDITEQTNLLSLNASIEAARAGEHGRGFSVVAGEVRKLAVRTSQIAREISQIVSKFEAEVEKAINTINLISQDVSSNAGKASQSISALSEISGNFTKIKDQVQSIATAFTEQERASAEIARSISIVSSFLEESKRLLDGIMKTVEELKTEAEKLNKTVKNFKY